MIRLTKIGPHDPAHGAAITWLANRNATYLTDLAADKDLGRFEDDYRNAGVKAAILAETAEKCAYCESKYRSTQFGDVEHIAPKSKFPQRRLDYANLTLACRWCNGAKGDYYDSFSTLLDPYQDTPDAVLLAVGTLLRVKPGAQTIRDRAAKTIVKVDLNRADLVEKRKEHLDRCEGVANNYTSTQDAFMRSVYRQQIVSMCEPDEEFSLLSRAYFALADLP
jgi:uncharacterized protein (TIGR02646 family)